MSRVIIPKENFPDPDIYTGNVGFRFRIITDDKNYMSYWSRIYSINSGITFVRGIKSIPGEVALQKNTGYVTAVWDSVAMYKEESIVSIVPEYDIWIRFASNGGANPGDWIYKERIAGTSLSIPIPSQYAYDGGLYASPKIMYFEVYRPGKPIKRYIKNSFTITQNSSSVNTTLETVKLTTSPTDHGLVTGDSVIYTATTPIGGLTSGNMYWVQRVSSTDISLFVNQSDALNMVNKINLSSTGSGAGTFDYYPFLLYKTMITTL